MGFFGPCLVLDCKFFAYMAAELVIGLLVAGTRLYWPEWALRRTAGLRWAGDPSCTQMDADAVKRIPAVMRNAADRTRPEYGEKLRSRLRHRNV